MIASNDEANRAESLIREAASLQVADAWHIVDPGPATSALRYRLGKHGAVCHVFYDELWDAGEPIYGHFNVIVGSHKERVIIPEDLFHAVLRRNGTSPIFQLPLAMERADALARDQGWLLLSTPPIRPGGPHVDRNEF